MSGTTPLPRVGAPATRALHAAGIHRLEDLAGRDRDEVATLHGVGPKALRLLEDALRDNGLALAD